jgi:hypothetical protein
MDPPLFKKCTKKLPFIFKHISNVIVTDLFQLFKLLFNGHTKQHWQAPFFVYGSAGGLINKGKIQITRRNMQKIEMRTGRDKHHLVY